MRANGPAADVKDVSDDFVGMALGDHADNLLFARAEFDMGSGRFRRPDQQVAVAAQFDTVVTSGGRAAQIASAWTTAGSGSIDSWRQCDAAAALGLTSRVNGNNVRNLGNGVPARSYR